MIEYRPDFLLYLMDMNSLPPLTFTVGFLTHADQVLMLQRKKSPNQGKWNGVGGHIEIGESPFESMRREIFEETGIQVDALRFGGILTWEGFEIERGGLYIFSAAVPSSIFVRCEEGDLAWQSRQFAFSHGDVVDNIHYFLPPVLAGEPPKHYHFGYQNGHISERLIMPLPAAVNIHLPFGLSIGY